MNSGKQKIKPELMRLLDGDANNPHMVNIRFAVSKNPEEVQTDLLALGMEMVSCGRSLAIVNSTANAIKSACDKTWVISIDPPQPLSTKLSLQG